MAALTTRQKTQHPKPVVHAFPPSKADRIEAQEQTQASIEITDVLMHRPRIWLKMAHRPLAVIVLRFPVRDEDEYIGGGEKRRYGEDGYKLRLQRWRGQDRREEDQH